LAHRGKTGSGVELDWLLSSDDGWTEDMLFSGTGGLGSALVSGRPNYRPGSGTINNID
jgi:hypothetical protein